MRITTKGRYALRAMANLAKNSSDKPKAIKLIATEENISPEFLEQIFFKLKKLEVIESVRGPGGGFRLKMPAEKITMRLVFDSVEEGLDLTPCTSCSGEDPICQNKEECLMREVWHQASQQIISYFESINLQQIVDRTLPGTMNRLLAGQTVELS